MDERLQRLERAFREAPQDAGVALKLGRLCLRAGRPARALTVTRPHSPPGEREAAASALGRRLGLELVGIDAFERFLCQGAELVLIPGGAYLEEGANAWSSSLLLGGSRAPLRRVVLPDFLIATRVAPAARRDEARQEALARGGRLPTPAEWKKAWRGGLFLDGDETALRPNPEPDRIAPWGSDPAPGRSAASPYGLLFRLDRTVCEWNGENDGVGLVLRVDTGRYYIPLRTPEERRGLDLAWRLVLEVDPRL